MDEGYKTSLAELESAPTLKLPMLAHKFTERKHDIVWPAFASPKLDGNRLVVQTNLNKCIYTTRTGKEFAGDFSHLDEPIKEFIETVGIPDGEAYIHGLLLQDIVALTKKKRENSAEIEYWIFDIINTELPFDTRYQKIRSFFDTKNCLINNQGFRIYKNIVEVPNYEIKDEAELEQYHTNFIQLGFEGTMIRNKKGLYKPNYRSSDLLKKKDFLEEEFKIIGGKSAEGNDIGTVIFTCETPEGKPFDVRPKGTREQRKEWLENIDKLVNKVLTVRFQYYSKDKIPCHLRGICIRDYE